jgi:hypothetical protein
MTVDLVIQEHQVKNNVAAALSGFFKTSGESERREYTKHPPVYTGQADT